MLSLKIGICEEDPKYTNKLVSYLSSNTNHYINTQIITDKNNLIKLQEKNNWDIILLDEKIYLEIKEEIIHNNIIILVEDFIENEDERLFYLKKFQQGKKILRKIIHYYTSNTRKEILNKNEDTKIIGFYSPFGGSGKTTISIALANTLSLQGKNTLFFSLDDNPSYTLLFEETESSMSDLFYHIRRDTKNLAMKLEGIQGIDYQTKLKYISPITHLEDIRDIKIHEFEYFINYLLRKKTYDYIIIDFSNEYSLRNEKLLERCNYKIILSNHNQVNKVRLEKFLNILDKGEGMLIYNNNYNDIISNKNIEGVEPLYIIPYSNDLYIDKGDIISINLDNEFGQVISRLAKMINS